VSGEPLCRCKAHMGGEPDSHHTEADHKHDCWSWPPCGGCWSCMAMTVAYWEARRDLNKDDNFITHVVSW
jgi:hypothetical protein